MVRKILFMLLLLKLLSPIYSQENKLDSLHNELVNASSEDSTKILIMLAEEASNQSYDSSCLQYSIKAIKCAQKNNQTKFTGRAYNWYGNALSILNDTTGSLQAYNQALTIFKKIDDFDNIAKVYHNLSHLYYIKGEIKKAIRIANTALLLREKHQLPDAALYSKLSIYYELVGMYEKSLELSFKAIELSKKSGNKEYMAISYNTIANVYRKTKRLDEAEIFYSKAYNILIEIKHNINASIALQNLAELFYDKKDYKQSQEYLKKALKMQKAIDYELGLIQSNHRAGVLHATTGEFEKSMLFFSNAISIADKISNYRLKSEIINSKANAFYNINDFGQAKFFFLQSNTLALTQNNHEISMNNYLFLSKIDSINNDFESVHKNFLKYTNIKDSLADMTKDKKLLELQIRFEVKQKEEQIVALLKQTKLQNKIYIVTTILFLIILLVGYLLFKRYRLKAKYKNEINLRKQEELSAQNEISRLNSEKLRTELAHRNRELTSSALSLSQRNDTLINIKERLLLLTNGEKKSSELKKLAKEIELNLNGDDDWKRFRYHFEQVHPDFLSSLNANYPELTANELKLCAYTKLNLSQKEIANLLNINHQSVHVARSRLKKKLKLSTEDNLTEWLFSFKANVTAAN